MDRVFQILGFMAAMDGVIILTFVTVGVVIAVFRSIGRVK